MKTALILTTLFLASVASADPAPVTYTYRVKVPADSGLSCAAHASAVATAFAEETGAQGVTGTCQSTETLTEGGQQYGQEILIVSYQGGVTLSPYQAVFGGTTFLGQSDGGQGLFATYADCLTQIGKLEGQFTQETGFAPVVAHCDPASYDGGYTATLEGFGRPARSLWGYAEDASIEGDAYAADVTKLATAALQAFGADIAYTDATHIFYYSEFDPTVTTTDLGNFSVAEQCTSQLAAAKAIYEGAGLSGTTAVCEPFGSATSTQVALVVVGAGYAQLNDDYGTGSPAYDSFDECQADLPRLIANASAGGAIKIYGAICSPSDNHLTGFQALLFDGRI